MHKPTLSLSVRTGPRSANMISLSVLMHLNLCYCLLIFILIVADICFLHCKAAAICFAKYAVSVKFPTTTLVHSYLKDEALHEHYHLQIGTVHVFQTFSVDIHDDIHWL